MIATVPDYTGSAAPHTALQVSGVARLMGRTDAPIQGASATQASTTCQVSPGCEGHFKLLACGVLEVLISMIACLLVGRHSREAAQWQEVCCVHDFTNDINDGFSAHAHTCTRTHTHTHAHTRTRTRTRTHTHTHAHTHTHTRTQAKRPRPQSTR